MSGGVLGRVVDVDAGGPGSSTRSGDGIGAGASAGAGAGVGIGIGVGIGQPAGRSALTHWIVGHTMMLAVMAFAMIGGHSIARTGLAVVVFLGWAAVVAVRVRLGHLPADVHSVIDLLAMAAITAVPLLTAAGGAGHHGAAEAGGAMAAAGATAGAAAGATSVVAVLVASGVFAGWIVFRSGLRGAEPLPARRLVVAGTAVTAASLGLMVLAVAAGWH